MCDLKQLWKVLTRKKALDPVSEERSELGRVLNTLDLTALGVGSTLGVGVYVLAGHVAKDTAGPSVVLSFLIATIASVFAGLCYAEFGARAPRAGSAYIYSYVCVGEFIAFVIGWNLILEYVIGSASVARGLSLYLDTLLNHTLEDTFKEIAPIRIEYMSEYFDFFAFGISILLSVALAFGMRESSKMNNIFTALNLAVVLFVVIAGGIKADPKNWNLSPPANMTHVGSGGFFPFGIEGMIKGAATCFYGFVGFDCIATTGEEVKNPKKAIPFSIIISLFIIFAAYFSTSTVVTMMIPYYDQDPDAPIPHAFEAIGWEIPKWIVAIGGIFGLCASLFGAMFPLPRIIYAMASDGIIFRFLGKVSQRFQTPVTGTLLAGLFTGLMAAMFELKQLVNMMSIGTLLAYTIVAASVLLLRYTENSYNNDGLEMSPTQETVSSTGFLKQIFNFGRMDQPTLVSERIVSIAVCLYAVLCILIGLCAMYLKGPIARGEIYAIVLTSFVVFLSVLVIISITTQPKSRKELTFKVPLVPLIPALSILINIYLMLMLDTNTWIRFAVWMAIGVPTYFFSVKKDGDACNTAIPKVSILSNGRLSGLDNFAFVGEDKETHFKVNTDKPLKETTFVDEEAMRKVEQSLNQKEPELDPNYLEEHDDSSMEKVLEEISEIVSKESLKDSLENTITSITKEGKVPESLPCSKETSSSSSLQEVINPSPIKEEVETPPSLQSTDDPLAIGTSLVPPPEDCPPNSPLPNEKEIFGDKPSEEELSQSPSAPIISLTPRPPPFPDSFSQVPITTLAPPPPPLPEVSTQPLISPSLSSFLPPPLLAFSSPSITLSGESVPPPPPPPPPQTPHSDSDWLSFEPLDLPRATLDFNEMKTHKLKKTKRSAPKVPPPDYSRENSVEVIGNLKKGTPEYDNFRNALNKTLVPVVLNDPPKKVVHLVYDPSNVLTDSIDKEKAEKALMNLVEEKKSAYDRNSAVLREVNELINKERDDPKRIVLEKAIVFDGIQSKND